jgi:transcriptional regulator with XRE-family HTH domain
MTPAEALKRIEALGATQFLFCEMLGINVANFSRYLRGDTKQISLEKQNELDKALSNCEELKTLFGLVPISFRDARKVEAAVTYLQENRPVFDALKQFVVPAFDRAVSK